MTPRQWDVIVVGGGCDGLAVAATLAMAGRSVLVLESRETFGGRGGKEVFSPGYTAPGLLPELSRVSPDMMEALHLSRFGLTLRNDEPDRVAFGDDGQSLCFSSQPGVTAASLAAFSEKDASRWPEYLAQLNTWAVPLGRLWSHPPPGTGSGGSIWDLLGAGLSLRRLGRSSLSELLRVGPMASADWMSEWFETPLLQAALAGPGLVGTWMGPRSTGSAGRQLILNATEQATVLGEPGALADALEQACVNGGVELRSNATVASIEVDGEGVAGVTLEDGEVCPAKQVFATCDPVQTVLGLLSPQSAPPSFRKDLSHFRQRGTTAVIRLALKGPVDWGRGGVSIERASLGYDCLDDLERAFDGLLKDQIQKSLPMEIWIPSVFDRDLAPEGGEVVSVTVTFVPQDLKGGWTDKKRASLQKAVVSSLNSQFPGLSGQVVGSQVLDPSRLEENFGLTGGHLLHGEVSLDQMLHLRPSPDGAGYKTPVPGLTLCGAGSHPGCDVPALSGWLAARSLLAQEDAS